MAKKSNRENMGNENSANSSSGDSSTTQTVPSLAEVITNEGSPVVTGPTDEQVNQAIADSDKADENAAKSIGAIISNGQPEPAAEVVSRKRHRGLNAVFGRMVKEAEKLENKANLLLAEAQQIRRAIKVAQGVEDADEPAE